MEKKKATPQNIWQKVWCENVGFFLAFFMKKTRFLDIFPKAILLGSKILNLKIKHTKKTQRMP